MKPDSALTAFCVFVAALLAGSALAFSCQAHGSEQRGTLAALRALPVAAADRSPDLADEKRAQLEAFAAAIERHATDRRVRAFLIAWGFHESGYSLAVVDGNCPPPSCDHGLARGAFQEHRNGRPQEEWDRLHGLANIDAQVASAAARARRALAWCSAAEGAFRSMSGRGCSGRLPDAAARVVTYQRALGRL